MATEDERGQMVGSDTEFYRQIKDLGKIRGGNSPALTNESAGC